MITNDFKRAVVVATVLAALVSYAFLVPKDWLLGTRIVLLTATFFSLVLYMDVRRTKWVFSVVAFALAGSSPRHDLPGCYELPEPLPECRTLAGNLYGLRSLVDHPGVEAT